MSTLANFLDIRKDSKQMFEGLAISKNTELCKKWMNQCPVVFFSFKDTDGLTFESAYGMLCMKLAFAFQDYQFLLDDAAISDDDKGIFKRILGRTASIDETKSCFLLLTRMLEIHFKNRRSSFWMSMMFPLQSQQQRILFADAGRDAGYDEHHAQRQYFA